MPRPNVLFVLTEIRTPSLDRITALVDSPNFFDIAGCAAMPARQLASPGGK